VVKDLGSYQSSFHSLREHKGKLLFEKMHTVQLVLDLCGERHVCLYSLKLLAISASIVLYKSALNLGNGKTGTYHSH
jgi:hypothetical protein